MNKRKVWKKSAFSELPEEPVKKTKNLSCSQSDDITARVVQQPETTTVATSCCNSNWIDNFAPHSTAELAIHAKKIEELQNWFCHCEAVRKKFPAQLCLLTGPAGAGKTAAVRVLAKVNNYQLLEWINPIDSEMVTTLGDQAEGSAYVVSQLQTFKQFLLRASRYKSLFDVSAKRLLMVEDFPNALLRDASVFENILQDYLNYGKSPLIFVVADAKTRALNISYNLFSEQIKSKFFINHISFNPIATTIIQKAVKHFCTIMQQPDYKNTYEVPKQSIVDAIVVSAQGDIRNALLNLHFASLKGAPILSTKHSELGESTLNKRKKKKNTTFKSLGRDESITMLHALGRVFNPKFNEAHQLLHCPEDIAENFSTEPKKFLEFTHANYLQHFSDIAQLLEAASDLSQADVILNEFRDDALATLALNIGVRSVMVTNTKPVSAWMPVRGPKRLNAIKRTDNELTMNIPTNLYASDYRTYVEIITKNKQWG